MTKLKPLHIVSLIGIITAGALATEALFVVYGGSKVPTPLTPRTTTVSGSGPALTYVVMGDSTSVSQGSDYKDGFAMGSARHLAAHYTVSLTNTGISGATTKTVLDEQLAAAVNLKPDIVLLAVGANDTTHFTSGASIKNSAQQIIDGLKRANPAVKIIVTRSPAMDSVTRFPFVSKLVMRLRTAQVNAAFADVIEQNQNVTLAPIAEKTREPFLKDPTLTAADHFHPNARGYALWTPVINEALDTALIAK